MSFSSFLCHIGLHRWRSESEAKRYRHNTYWNKTQNRLDAAKPLIKVCTQCIRSGRVTKRVRAEADLVIQQRQVAQVRGAGKSGHERGVERRARRGERRGGKPVGQAAGVRIAHPQPRPEGCGLHVSDPRPAPFRAGLMRKSGRADHPPSRYSHSSGF